MSPVTLEPIVLRVPGRPVGKGRPRFNRSTGRVYTPAQTVTFEQRVQTEWIAAGRPRLPDGPFVAQIAAVYQRPASHMLKNGGLSAAGRRAPFPMPPVDLDNLAKSLLDAGNGLLYKDDRQAVQLFVRRRWCGLGEVEHTVLEVARIIAPVEQAAA